MAKNPETKTDPGKTVLLICLALVAAQTIFFTGWIWLEENHSGEEIRVALEPVDPRDLLRGQYLDLSFAFDRSDAYPQGDVGASPPLLGGMIHALLVIDEDGLHIPLAYANDRHELLSLVNASSSLRPVILRGRCDFIGISFDFGLNRYFVPEGTAEPPPSRTQAVIMVSDDGSARVKQLLVDGKPWTPAPPGDDDGKS